MSFVNRIYLLTACLSSIRVVQSASSRDQINDEIVGSSTGTVTISLTADITNFAEILIGTGKDVTIVSDLVQQGRSGQHRGRHVLFIVLYLAQIRCSAWPNLVQQVRLRYVAPHLARRAVDLRRRHRCRG